MPGVSSVNATRLNDIFEVYGLKQLITDPILELHDILLR